MKCHLIQINSTRVQLAFKMFTSMFAKFKVCMFPKSS